MVCTLRPRAQIPEMKPVALRVEICGTDAIELLRDKARTGDYDVGSFLLQPQPTHEPLRSTIERPPRLDAILYRLFPSLPPILGPSVGVAA